MTKIVDYKKGNHMNLSKLNLTDDEYKELKLEQDYYSQFGTEIKKLDKMP